MGSEMCIRDRWHTSINQVGVLPIFVDKRLCSAMKFLAVWAPEIRIYNQAESPVFGAKKRLVVGILSRDIFLDGSLSFPSRLGFFLAQLRKP